MRLPADHDEIAGEVSTSSLLLWLWLLLAFARPLLPLLPLISYTICPLPLCVVIAPFFLAFICLFSHKHTWDDTNLVILLPR